MMTSPVKIMTYYDFRLKEEAKGLVIDGPHPGKRGIGLRRKTDRDGPAGKHPDRPR